MYILGFILAIAFIVMIKKLAVSYQEWQIQKNLLETLLYQKKHNKDFWSILQLNDRFVISSPTIQIKLFKESLNLEVTTQKTKELLIRLTEEKHRQLIECCETL